MTNMKTFVSLLITMLLLTFSQQLAFARYLTPEEAINRIKTYNCSSEVRKKIAIEKASPELAFTVQSIAEDGKDDLYVFNNPTGGYFVTSTDDRFPIILGYGDKGYIEKDKMPPALKWWLNEYTRQMEYVRSITKEEASWEYRSNKHNKSIQNDKDPIEPLIESKWNQHEPYNLLCPIVVNGNGEKERTVTGCVPTALSQVMYYHKWPNIGAGQISYNWEVPYSTETKEIGLDFSKVNFRWDKMRNSYVENEYNDDEGLAVAELMYAVGVSINAKYNPTATPASPVKIPSALETYFGYAPTSRILWRDHVEPNEWEDSIYNSLKRKLPVLISGNAGNDGGHEFVCDGYYSDHYFHINWGWGGYADGYFLFCDLTDFSDFSYHQTAIVNLRPAKSGEIYGERIPKIGLNSDLIVTEISESELRIGWDSPDIFTSLKNCSDVEFTGKIGVYSENENGYESTHYVYSINNLVVGGGWTKLNFVVKAKDLLPGKNKLRLAYQFKDKWYDVEYVRGHKSSVTVVVSDDHKFILSEIDKDYESTESSNLAVTGFDYYGPAFADNHIQFDLSFTNLSLENEYEGLIYMNVTNNTENIISSNSIKLLLSPDVTIFKTINISLPLMAGDYTVTFKDKYGKVIPGAYNLKMPENLNNEYKRDTELELYGFTPFRFIPHESPDDKCRFTFKVKNITDHEITDPRICIIFEDNNGEKCYECGSIWKGWTIKSRETVDLGLVNCPLNNIRTGKTLPEGIYRARVCRKELDPTTGKDIYYFISDYFSISLEYSIEDITLSENTYNFRHIGDIHNLKVNILPLRATNKQIYWFSENENVVVVDGNGLMTAKGNGTAYVVSTTSSGQYDLCKVTVGGASDVNDIQQDDQITAVYNVNGVKVLNYPEKEELSNLVSGIYIVVTKKRTYKFCSRE